MRASSRGIVMDRHPIMAVDPASGLLCGLPDYHAFGFGAEHGVAFGDAECFEEGCDVAQGDVDAVDAERVDVACGERAYLFGADVGGPEVGVVHVEHLGG